ncbi:MAG TPA: DUF4333 domain-containing protein [Thermosynechococcaceae cyanobacterium]
MKTNSQLDPVESSQSKSDHHKSTQGNPAVLKTMSLVVTVLSLGLALASCSTTQTPPAATNSPAAPAASPSPAPTASISGSPQSSPVAGGDKSEGTKVVESAIVTDLSPKIPSPITAADCPNVGKVETGTTLNCTATIAEGTFPVVVTLMGEDANISPKNLLNLSAIEQKLVETIKSQNQIDVQADCGGKVKVFKDVGESFECKIAQPDGKTATAAVTVTTPEGKVSFKVL